jgi:hypothetical protein
LAVSATVGEGVASTGGKQGVVVRLTGLLSQPPSAKRTVSHVEVRHHNLSRETPVIYFVD